MAVMATLSFYLVVGAVVVALVLEGELIASEAFAILGLSLNPVSLAFGYFFSKDDTDTGSDIRESF